MFTIRVMEQENEDRNNMQGKCLDFSVGGPLHNGPSLETSAWHIFHCFCKGCVQMEMPINIWIYS